MKKVIEFIKSNLSNETVVVACSGGPDSMCLLDLLTKLKEEQNLKKWSVTQNEFIKNTSYCNHRI